MPLARTTAIACLFAAAVLTGYGQQGSPANRPWPPGVQQVPPDSPPLAPEAALQTFYMPPGYHVELVASEPLIQDPVAIDWDADGRLWAVEMPGFMRDVAASSERDPIGRVVVLEDKDGDGRMDKRTVFADGLVLARSLKVLDRGVLVAEPPDLWLMRDRDGDLRMDEKERVTDRFGRRETDPENNANTMFWGLDNWMYTSGLTTIQLRLKNGAFELRDTLQRGEWGVTQDDAGRIYRNTNESPVHVDYVPSHYYARHPFLLRTRGSYERVADDANAVDTIWPVRPNPGTNRAYQSGIDRADGTLARFTSACAPLIFNGAQLPAELYGNVFVAEPAANVVSRIVLTDTGKDLEARKAYERGEFLASTDERFRPVYLSNAPDGTLTVVDMYRGIIEHRLSLTEYLRDHIVSRKLEQPISYGRIYRVVHDTTRRDVRPGPAQASADDLVRMLGDSGGWRRETAQRLLVERADRLRDPASRAFSESGRAVVRALGELASGTQAWPVRLRALWTLDGIDAIEQDQVIKALDDRAPEVRAAGVRLAERWLDRALVRDAFLRRGADDSWHVRRQYAASLGALPGEARPEAAAALLDRFGDDPVTLDAALSGVRTMEGEVMTRLLRSAAQSPQLDASIAMLAATIVRSNDERVANQIFEWTADANRPAWQRSALLSGAEIALLNTPMPGTRRAASAAAAAPALPCPTCPGGRAGPGGAYAFSKPEDFARAGLRPGTAPRVLRVNGEPVALVRLANEDGGLRDRAGRVLTRVTWPGKDGAAVPADAPLTADEQRRFDRGRDVYASICQACHQPDGRGQERLAPSLVGSPLLLGSPEIPIRILLHGKEGTIGLMPPIGATLPDEDIASVLTYVRREWEQGSRPVDAETVGKVRTATAGRTRPWTEAELKTTAGR